MKKTAILMLVVAMSVANAAPAEDVKPQPEVVKSVYHNNGDKGYDFDIETSDGAKRQETGTFRYVGGLAVTGSYQFVGDDGITYTVTYTADEKGFRPSAPHIPAA